MPINPDKLWTDMAEGLRRKLGLLPPATPEEAEAQFDAAEETPLSEEQIDRITDYACGARPSQTAQPSYPEDLSDLDLSRVEDPMGVLNRNAGDEDPAVEAKKRELRKKALEKRRARQQNQDEDGLADGGTPASDGR